MIRIDRLLLALAAALLPQLAWSANILPSTVSSFNPVGTFGTLRAGSIWAPAPASQSPTTLVDNVFLPTGTVWTNGTVWWDQDPSINAFNAYIEINLVSPQNVNRFVVQADDNDSYQLDYWDGASWKSAFTVAPVYTYGMETRDSGVGATITTSKLRFYATGGDNYYSVSEIQAFEAIPEPSTYALVIAGLALLGAAARRRHG